MFDDPKKELERLQKELLAAQEEPEDEDIDTDQALEDVRRMLARAHPNRLILHNGEINTIRGNVDRMLAREEWEEDRREPLYRSYTDWEEEAPPRRTAIYDYEEDEDPEPPRPRRRSRYGFLLAVLVLETVALAVMALWWFLWLM